jgi:hypothetical protein
MQRNSKSSNEDRLTRVIFSSNKTIEIGSFSDNVEQKTYKDKVRNLAEKYVDFLINQTQIGLFQNCFFISENINGFKFTKFYTYSKENVDVFRKYCKKLEKKFKKG